MLPLTVTEGQARPASPQAQQTISQTNSKATQAKQATRQPQLVSTQEQQSTSPGQTTPQTVKPATYKAIPSIRANRLKKTDETEITTEPTKTPLPEETFTVESLQQAWTGFSKMIPEDIHLINSIKSSLPVQLEGYHYEVVVANPVVKKKLDELNGRIELYLQQTLKNGSIKLTIRLDETLENSRPYTARDRFEVMTKKNPHLLDLYKQFGLEID